MFKIRLSLFLSILFWLAPLCFFLGWQVVLYYPSLFPAVVIISLLLLIPVAYEAAGRKRGWRAGFIFISLGLLLSSFFLFISFLSSRWLVQLLWLPIIYYFYRYFWTIKKIDSTGSAAEWAQVSLYGGLLTIFLTASSLFGLQAFLSLSPWPLLAAFAIILLANTQALAFSQGWNNKAYFWLWPFLTLIIAEIAMMLTLLPLNYLISGILTALAYYSALNFIRLYLNNSLTKRKIKNYAWFTAISLIVILLTARWL